MEKNSKSTLPVKTRQVGSPSSAAAAQGYTNIITRTTPKFRRPHQPAGVNDFCRRKARHVPRRRKVGGSRRNSSALADFMYDTMMLELNRHPRGMGNGCKKLEIPRLVVHLPPHGPASPCPKFMPAHSAGEDQRGVCARKISG